MQAAAVVDKDLGAPVASLGEFVLHLRKESSFGSYHLINGDALSWLGCDKDLVRGLRFFSHRTIEVASAFGWRDGCQLLGDFPVEGKHLSSAKVR